MESNTLRKGEFLLVHSVWRAHDFLVGLRLKYIYHRIEKPGTGRRDVTAATNLACLLLWCKYLIPHPCLLPHILRNALFQGPIKIRGDKKKVKRNSIPSYTSLFVYFKFSGSFKAQTHIVHVNHQSSITPVHHKSHYDQHMILCRERRSPVECPPRQLKIRKNWKRRE